ncbi:hypothetical protein F4808DRAFT_471964 [Astrocystis sublimbata]|nr:hypothetical protein F4808DRAFT_471964 [Astrocystis sublimbata]
MSVNLKLYLFGDQTHDTKPHLKLLLQCRDNPLLDHFLRKAYDALRREIYELPHDMRDVLPRFTSLDDLMLWDQGGRWCVPLDMAITCLCQLGLFFSQANDNIGSQTSRYVGLCTGALSAAAVSCSRSTLDLVPKAVDAIIVAFRTGIHVTEVAERIAPTNSAGETWSIIVTGSTASGAVQKFCAQSILPLTSRPYISAYAPYGITVSGPPRTIAQFVDSECFKGLRYKAIPIYAPYHAPHLHTESDVIDIVGSLTHDLVQPSEQSGMGDAVEGPSFTASLKAAIEQILLQPIQWKDILDDLQSWIQSSETKTFSIAPIVTTADQLIYTALKQTPLRALMPSTSAPSPLKSTGWENTSYAHPQKPKLAIISMAGRFPGARDTEAFWDLLYEGLDVHKPVPPLHWDAKTHVDPTGNGKNTSATPFGCWLDDPAEFDARFFNISPREAPQIDPAQRLALMTAYEAIEQAGIVPDATASTRRDRVGVFYGVTSNDWMETNSAQNIDTYFIPGGNRAFIPGRINYCFKFSGPSYAIDTACSSSLAGIHLACSLLWRGDIDTAIAGGTNVLTNPDFTAGLDRGHFLSRTGNCKTFDDEADGYCRGEGIGTVIIKRLDDALADNDPILGVILGAYTNHSAESESITRPHVGAQRAIFSKILNQGGVDPYTVSYVEMHGTGTQAGDAGEMSSAKRGREKHQVLFLGSAKPNIGHGEAASGVSSLIKVLLMMQKNTIVPHCGIKTRINRKFPTDLKERNVRIAAKANSWERDSDPSEPRRAFVNNFSAAGGNSALLLEDAPRENNPIKKVPDPRKVHLIAVSAKTSTSLQGNLESTLEFLMRNPDVSLGQLSYTTTARRMHHQHRVMVVGSSVEGMSSQISAALRDRTGMTRPKGSPKVIFLFTGQGAQYSGMGKQLLEYFSLFRIEVRRLDQLGQNLGFPSMLPIIESEEQDIGVFGPTAVQLASVIMQIALSKLWASWNITPAAVIGHSLGEYAALNVAGVLSDADTIYLVGTRAELLQEKCTRGTHSMIVAKGSMNDIAEVLRDVDYEVACINSPTETVLAGPDEKISIVKGLLTGAKIKSTLLHVPYAFHSSQIDPILSDFKRLSGGITFSEAKVPVVCPLDGSIKGVANPEYLTRHSREPVNMFKALRLAYSQQILTDQTMMLEVGPHPAISGMVRAVLGPQVVCLASSQRGRSCWDVLSTTLKALYEAGADIRWAEYQRDFQSSHRVIPLPAYSWDLKEYWMQYFNDWSLRKGEPPLVLDSPKPMLESTTIHRIVSQSGDTQKMHIVVEANIARDDLSPLVQGHEVDGTPLCTPSVYADIALTLGTYILQRYRPGQIENRIDVSDMSISKALILQAQVTEQLLQAHAEVDWSSQSVVIIFMSFDSKQKLQEHARCVVRFRDRSLQETLQCKSASLREKLQALEDGIVTGVTARFNRPMVYRAIRPLARFHDDYRAIDKIVLNSTTLEVSSHLSFGAVKRSGSFHTHPAIIDALAQAGGFALNCNDNNDLDVEVFMNHGWGSLQIFEPISFDKEYVTYTRMQEGVDKLWHGNTFILQGDKIVAYFGQIALQCVPRRVLKVVLSIASGDKKQKQQRQPVETKQLPVRNSTHDAALLDPAGVVERKSHASKIRQAINIIAEESGLAELDLADSTCFADVGIDSLLGLTISARFNEELNMELDFNALFYEHPTVGDLKVLFGADSGANRMTAESQSGSSDTAESARNSGTGITTPDATGRIGKLEFRRALQILSEESGIAIEDLTDDTNFADSGVDSLLSLIVVSRFRDELEVDIQHETIFLECPTVADLRRLLLGDAEADSNDSHTHVHVNSKPNPTLPPASIQGLVVDEHSSRRTERDTLRAREEAVDTYVRKNTFGFRLLRPAPLLGVTQEDGKVVLITGASGSLGGHLVYHIAQLPDVKCVVCLNRENKTEPFSRQQKAMREKGIRFPEALKPKLRVLQTESSKPNLGLLVEEYETLANSVTHLIHNAWPMSAKRQLDGFEPQFRIMRNLIDFANDATSRRPESFRFSFQMVSSIGVVGHYGLGNGKEKTIVPEKRVSIDSVLPNGYGDAKWGCERMLDETLHKHPDRFRTMVVRLGQIAGSKTSGYWNPMEHFGFLIKSSQTLNALPDVGGTVYWTPVNDIAGTLSDLLLSNRTPYPIYHIENPVGQPWREMNVILADALNIPNLIPFEQWVERVRDAPQKNNPAVTLLDFLDSNYLRMSCGGLVLDVKRTLEHSPTLSAVGPVSNETIRKYIHIWKEIGFLSS